MRHLFSASVGVILNYYPPNCFGGPPKGLILCTKKDSGQLCLTAGAIEKGEDARKALFREIQEETGLDPELLKIGNVPDVIIIPGENKSSIGLVFESNQEHIPITSEGFVPESLEIALVKPYSVNELLELVHNPDIWYRPEFNLKIVKKWLRNWVDIKYGPFDGPKFVESVINAWGLKEE